MVDFPLPHIGVFENRQQVLSSVELQGILMEAHWILQLSISFRHPFLPHSIDWFKGNITGKSHISWENRWFPVDVPFN